MKSLMIPGVFFLAAIASNAKTVEDVDGNTVEMPKRDFGCTRRAYEHTDAMA